MGEKIVVGPLNKGLRNDVTPFNIDNESFPNLLNAYQWRSRVKRKRGTSTLGRLTRFFDSTSTSYSSTSTITLNGDGQGNLLTGFSLETNGNIVPESVEITVGANVYEDTDGDGILYLVLVASGTINYATGEIVIATQANNNASANFLYYPNLPVMGLEDLVLDSNDFPGTLAFDTTYSYNIKTTFPYEIYDVSFYKNPAVDATNLPGYIPKTTWTPTSWNGEDYQQFWSVNYQGALWATNGVETPFSITDIGMQYKAITGVTIITAGNGTNIPAVADITIVAHGLVQGDFLFINEVGGITGINFQTGYVTSANPQAANVVRVTFPFAILGGAYTSGGIAQYLTNRSDVTKDCIRWYDGDPTNGNATTPSFVEGSGWVNFCPPLSQDNFSIADLPEDQYYLVGAKMILPFKDRLIFIGPVVQTSAAGSQRYLKDTVIYSQNGTPYYTASYFNQPSAAVDTPASANIVFHPILLPDDQTSSSPAFFEDQTGFGGFTSAGIAQPIQTASQNGDVLILGFTTIQTRFVYTGNDIIPFLFYLINSELGSSSTFSIINMDKGVMTIGERGIVITSQVAADRFDEEIPDEVFEIKRLDNGTQRVCSQRDYINEWIYFTYPVDSIKHKFPTQTLQYNYKDVSWAVFRECYTTYGSFKKRTGLTWATIGTVYSSWKKWNVPWNAGSSSLLEPEVIAGNQQGFILVRDDGTNEGTSLYIQSFSGNQITSPDHCLSEGDYIIISGCIGTIGAEVNNRTFSVYNVTQNTFRIKPSISSGTYSGEGVITRIYVPFIQTKQFPLGWNLGRKTRIGVQQYLLTKTANAQIQLLMFLSQNAASAYNQGPIVPNVNSVNNSLIYSTVLYTCPESTNIGLTPANINLQTPTASNQSQIWHRINTSLIGDTVQLGFTMSDAQIRSLDPSGESFEITAATQAYPCVIDCTAQFPIDSLIIIEDVEGMTQLNGNVYTVISSSSTQVTINVDSTGFSAYSSGGTATRVSNNNQFSEIELHGFIIDVTPSQMLV